MTSLTSPILAETAKTTFEPLFGSQWIALLVIVAGIAVFMFAVAAVGRWLAATHPDEPLQPAPVVEPAPAVEIFAVIAAAVAVTLGSKARITAVNLAPADGDAAEPARQQWSMEGRRQIYSSHKVR